MKYVSSRNSLLKVNSAEAIVTGLAPDGGLFLPETMPCFSLAEIADLAKMDYPHRCSMILSRFLTDFTEEEILGYATRAYCKDKFAADQVAPVVKLSDSTYILELFHGPTCAFKDFALQMLPFLLTASLRKTGIDKEVLILVATSGDTGKAALEGFADVPGTKICVFFPEGGTSNIQRLQMVTQSGENVMVAAVKGNFDDAQNGVKAIFMDKDYQAQLAEQGHMLSSANSINWGRLVPQIVYYYSAYCDLLNRGVVALGEKINFTVPTGNFGNILAAYLAKLSGLPVQRFICASNKNNVLTDFITTGTYDRNRPFYLTSSPSMDILISSNLERLLYLLSGKDDAQVRSYMQDLSTKGCYTVSSEILAALQQEFSCGYADDDKTAAIINDSFTRHEYLCDTHTAVAIGVYNDYRNATGDSTPTVIDSTASPFKFCGSVLQALGKDIPDDDFAMLDEVEKLAGLAVPTRLAELKNKPARFTDSVPPEGMKAVVSSMI